MQNFEEIRPYNDDEVQAAIKTLVVDPMFQSLITKFYPQSDQHDGILKKLSVISSIDQLQAELVYPLVLQIVNNSTSGLAYSAMEQFKPDQSYLFISNHRDIILDSAFLNSIMHRHGFKKTEIAIGDNLLIFDWIKTFVRLNRAFIVKRSLSIRQQLEASKTLSAYIRYAISEKKQSVWLAQREGRTKDGNDLTQMALLKMLNMSNKSSLVEGFKQLNIVPMGISYEVEPCAISKVEELLNKKHNPDYKKTQQDDLNSMANGVMQSKGRINFGFGNPLNIKIDELVEGKNNNEAIKAIVDYIDRRIYANYKLWPNNYIAADLLHRSEKYQEHYSAAEKDSFVQKMDADLDSLKFDYDESSEMYLKLYANPVINFEEKVINKEKGIN